MSSLGLLNRCVLRFGTCCGYVSCCLLNPAMGKSGHDGSIVRMF